MQHTISIEGIRLYAFHGCLEEESKIGGHYRVDIKLQTDFSKAAENDDLNSTIDYCEVYEIVKEEMQIRSKLIEQVAQRIVNRIQSQWTTALFQLSVKVTKINPPMNGDVQEVSVEITG